MHSTPTFAPPPAVPPLAGPLISVIITCYNHGRYLPEALASVWRQVCPALEVVVVDDGSRDNTRAVAEACADERLRYVYQPNQGLSAARNTGVRHSTGQYLVFLDADDWLLPTALACNAEYLQQHPELAFVSGGHDMVYEAAGEVHAVQYEVPTHHYQRLLQGNYIGMHAAVMYQRWVFECFAYDPTLQACEDYDLYLRVARHHPVGHHTQRLAAYRQHGTNMSGNAPLMLTHALAVLARQLPGLRGEAEAQAYAAGLAFWHNYYDPAPTPPDFSHLPFPARFRTVLAQLLKNHAPLWVQRLLHRAGRHSGFVPPVGRVAAGDLLRPAPFSRDFGYDRGGPIDRYYIERFLRQQAGCIRGRVLEIGDDSYTQQFGGVAVTQRDVLHVDASNERATLVGDLSAAPHLPDNSFDCLLVTQTLHLIYDFRAALDTCYRILRPGGTLLLTVPGLTPIDRGEWGTTWYWSFTEQALRCLLADAFPQGSSEVFSFGNVGVATAYLHGMGLPEITPLLLDFYDPQFQVINAVRATKYAPLA